MKLKTAMLYYFTLRYNAAKPITMQKLNMKMENYNKEFRSQEPECRIPSQPKNYCLIQRHKEHKDFLFVFLLNPKSKIPNPNFATESTEK